MKFVAILALGKTNRNSVDICVRLEVSSPLIIKFGVISCLHSQSRYNSGGVRLLRNA
jgi:hypothetical protein